MVFVTFQGNSAFEISRMFGWQPTNELAGKSGMLQLTLEGEISNSSSALISVKH